MCYAIYFASHPSAPIADRIQTMDIKDTLKIFDWR